MVAAHRTRAGETLYVVETRQLEAAPGWRYTHGGRKGRGACVMHGGDNPTAMEADFETGWIRCRTAGCVGRIAEHPDTRIGQPPPRGAGRAPIAPQARPERAKPAAPDLRALGGLNAALAAAQARLPGSPGERYLRERGFAPDVAQAHGLGWGAEKAMTGRVVFPLTDPTGAATSATGRDVSGRARAKYYTLPSPPYAKGWFNGAAVALARERGLPLYLAEGPFDALALLAGGIPTAAAVLGVKGVRADWLAGVPRIVVCFDADAAGQDGRAELAFAAAAVGATVELLPAAALGDCKDLGEYWAARRALPPQLVAHYAAAAAGLSADPAPAPPAPPGQMPPDAGPLPGLGLTDPAALALCPPAHRDEAARAAALLAPYGVVALAHVAEDLRAAYPDDDPDAPFWRAVLREADARRRDARPGLARCPDCGAELLPVARCRACRPWRRPDDVRGLSLALLADALPAAP